MPKEGTIEVCGYTLTGLDCPGLFRHASRAIINLGDIAQGRERIAEVVRKRLEYKGVFDELVDTDPTPDGGTD